MVFSHERNFVKPCPSLPAEQGITTQLSPQWVRKQPNPAWDYTILYRISPTFHAFAVLAWVFLNPSFSFSDFITSLTVWLFPIYLIYLIFLTQDLRLSRVSAPTAPSFSSPGIKNVGDWQYIKGELKQTTQSCGGLIRHRHWQVSRGGFLGPKWDEGNNDVLHHGSELLMLLNFKAFFFLILISWCVISSQLDFIMCMICFPSATKTEGMKPPSISLS